MARARSSTNTGNTENTDTPTINKEGRKMAGLTNEQIVALLAGGRQKGVYRERLVTFIGSGEGGISVSETFPDLAGKKATSLKTGFENVKKSKDAPEGADQVVVRVSEDKVYLINMAHVTAAAA